MKIIIAFVAAIICTVSVYADNKRPQNPSWDDCVIEHSAINDSIAKKKHFRFALDAELGLTNVVGEGDKPGFGTQLGLLADIYVSPKVFLESGILLPCITHREDGVSGSLRGVYAKVPFLVGSSSKETEKVNLTVQGGPYLAYGLYGNELDAGRYGTISYFDNLNRFDFGLEAKVGLEYRSVRWTLGAGYGLVSTLVNHSYHNLSILLGCASFF